MTKGQGDPQLKDGYTRIPNELLDMLAMLHVTPNCWKVLMFIIRKTYGFSKKVDYIANSQMVAGTNLCKSVVSRCLRTLQTQNLIVRNGKKVGLQDNYTLWQKLTISSTFKSEAGVEVSSIVNNKKLADLSTELAESSTKVSSCALTQKKKQNIQKKYISELLPILKILNTTNGYPYDEQKDSVFLKELQEDFQTVNLLFICKDFRAYHLDKPIKPGSNPRSQLRNFCKNEVKNIAVPAIHKPYQQVALIKTKSEATQLIEEMCK